MKEFRTDLALEVRESFEKEDVEIKGVALKEEFDKKTNVKVTTVEIRTQQGAQAMRKPIGTYITIEAQDFLEKDITYHKTISSILTQYLKRLFKKVKNGPVLVVGLGNREATPDSLGPKVVDGLCVTRHFIKEFGDTFTIKEKDHPLCAIAPGVMAQTGMETMELLKGIVKEIQPACVIAVDALAARSTNRLITTVQLTDTGICPGAGIGNNRQALNKESLGVDVIAIGVPTVVDAMTIVRDSLEYLFGQQEFTESQRDEFFQEITQNSGIINMFVTPKNIDESVQWISDTISEAINSCFVGKEQKSSETMVSNA